MYVREEGSGPDVLFLLHGLGDHSYAFRHAIGPLARAGWRVIAPDLPGFGRSPKPRAVLTLDGQAAVLERILEERAIPRAVFLGHSLGASLAIRMRASRAARVRALVLCGGGFYRFRRPLSHRLLQIPGLGEAIGLFRGPRLIRWMAEEGAERPLGRLPDSWVSEHWEPIRSWDGWRSLVGTIRSCSSARAMAESERDLLSMPPCPLLYIWGERDGWVPLPLAGPFLEAQVARMTAAGQAARIAIVPGAGHAPHEERPGEFVREVVSFLAPLRTVSHAGGSAAR